jgi:hypothetical protein
MKFITYNSPLHALSIGYNGVYKKSLVNMKFLCQYIGKNPTG